MPSKKLTVLFTPLDGWGHINACHGLAQELQSRGHRIVFAIDKAFRDKLTPFGFEEELHGKQSESAEDKEYWPQFMEKYCHYLREDTMVVAEKFFLPAAKKMFADNKERDHQYQDIINRVKPDVIITDAYINLPTLTNSGIPWVWLFSAAPHFGLNDERIPPPWSGLPINGDRKEWQTFRDRWNQLMGDFQKEVSDYSVSKGAPKLENMRLHPFSPYLNIYLYPKEMDYKELQPMSDKWIRVENFVRITNDTFEVPPHIQQRPGKLIFLSMGSFGCANLELMTRLTNVLGKSQHKFIVSKGPVFESHQLPDNMWGQRFLPQTAVLPLVDLVITHGGNNTVTETFYFGKPMLVLPLFGDQFDNGQRIEETGLGLRLNPFKCSDSELLKAVDRLVSDEGLAQKMKTIGKRIRNSKDKKVVSDLIENIFD